MLITERISPESRGVASRVPPSPARLHVAVATLSDRQEIYRIRHEIYARELRQLQTNDDGRLSDALDAHNLYLVVRMAGEIAGFVSVTPPSAPSYSMDKYIARSELPFSFDAGLYEVRLLTVLPAYRGQNVATLLMYAAYRWAESHGATQIAAIGRREIVDLYVKAGLRTLGLSAQSGAVTYDFLHATITELRARTGEYKELFDRLEARTEWRLNFPFRKPATCFHGGAFFAAVGERFDDLTRHRSIINADVLDAWFPPAPSVLETLEAELPWLLRTSPPTACTGLIDAIAEARGVASVNVLPGGGSSDLIFRALRQWLNPKSRVLVLDPTYGEYAHVLEKVIGCRVSRFTLERSDGYVVSCDRLKTALAEAYDLVVIVNPNSPTGRHIPRQELEELLRQAPAATRVWVDETYVEYAGAHQSLERFAAGSENVIVCKSMSKVYALSGVRVAYLCAGAHQIEELRAVTPPWVVSLPAQVAAVKALSSPEYYAARYAETHQLRNILASELGRLGWTVLPGVANFLLCHVPEAGSSAATLVAACRERGLFLRDAALMGSQLGSRAIRIAVKDAATNARMIDLITQCRG